MKKFLGFLAAFALLCGTCGAVGAGTYPDRPITLLTVFSPGGGSDAVHRLLEKYAKGLMPVPFVITYKTGAGGEFGWTELADAKPDGYFIGGVDLPHITLQPMVRKPGTPGYRTEQLQPIAGLLVDPNCIMVNKTGKWRNFKEFVEYAQRNPGKVRAAIVGKLTGDHIFILKFEKATGTKFNIIPYTGGPKVGPALQSGEVDCYFGSLSGHFRMDNTRCLAVATPERYELAGDIPTLREEGVDVVSVKRRGLAGPRGIAPEHVAYLQDVIRKINDNPDYIESMKKLGTLPVFQTAEEFGREIREETLNSAEVLKSLGYGRK